MVAHAMVLAIALQQGAARSELVVLATHRTPTKIEQVFLDRPFDEWKQLADTEGYVAEVREGIVYVRSKDLFNLEAMDQRIRSLSIVQSCARSKDRTLRLADLEPEEREDIKRFLSDSIVGRELGPLLERNSASIAVEARVSVTLTDGRRTIEIAVPQSGPKLPEGFFASEPTKDEQELYRQETSKKKSMKGYPDVLMFSFSRTNFPSATKASAAQVHCKLLYDLLEEQRKQYEGAQAATKAAILGEQKLPVDGDSLSALSDSFQQYLRDTVKRNSDRYGFGSGVQLGAFLDDARVKSVQINGSVGIGVTRANGQREMITTAFAFSRNPG